MGIRVAADIARDLLEDGFAAQTPVAVVYNAGAENEQIIASDLSRVAAGESLAPAVGEGDAVDGSPPPGLLIVGEIARYRYRADLGALRGQRVLVTCSGALQQRACDAVWDLGGVPIARPLIRMRVCDDAAVQVARLSAFDWVVVTSPSAARCFGTLLDRHAVDRRRLPHVMSCGPGTSRALRQLGIVADLEPRSDFGTAGLLAAVRERLAAGEADGQGTARLGDACAPGGVGAGARVLRLRSDRAGGALADGLRALGAEVVDCVLYRNEAVPQAAGGVPPCDAVFLASASAVDAFIGAWSVDALRGVTIVAMGTPTGDALAAHGLRPHITGREATVESAIQALAADTVTRDIYPTHGQQPGRTLQ